MNAIHRGAAESVPQGKSIGGVVVEVRCLATGATGNFASEEEAIDRGWLKVTAAPEGREARVVWFSPGRADQWAEVLIREGIATRELLAGAAQGFVREGRIRE